MINSKGETIYTSAEIAYELGISPTTVHAIGRRIFGSGRIAHWTLNDSKLIVEYIKSISVENDAKRLSVLHDMVESVYGGQTPLNADEVVQRVKKDLHNV